MIDNIYTMGHHHLMDDIPHDEAILYLRGDANLLHRGPEGRIVRPLNQNRTHEVFGEIWGDDAIFMGVFHGETFIIKSDCLTNILSWKKLLNQWEELQKIIVCHDTVMFMHIDNPSEEIQKILVQQQGSLISFISNPSEEVQRIAVQNDGLAIAQIINPSEEIQKLAVRENGLAIGFVDDPSEEINELAAQYMSNGFNFHANT